MYLTFSSIMSELSFSRSSLLSIESYSLSDSGSLQPGVDINTPGLASCKLEILWGSVNITVL